MLNTQQLVIDKFTASLELAYRETYGLMRPELGPVIGWAGRLALENIGNSDMLYHNIDHTMLVTAVGQEILLGKHLCEGGVKPSDWLNFMMSLLFHDIGYVRGVCRHDNHPRYATGEGDKTFRLPAGSTDAALTPYHVSRSQLFVRERFGGTILPDLDLDAITEGIEMTRFPPPNQAAYEATATYAGLVRAADFIGQLGDPNYLRKIPALFYEFQQLGDLNAKMSYRNPVEMRQGFASFYWKTVQPYTKDAMKYLGTTFDGKQWIANLRSHVFEVEHAGD